MSSTPPVPNPTGGGSFLRNADGSLTQVEGPKPAPAPDAPDATADEAPSSGETPAGAAPAGA